MSSLNAGDKAPDFKTVDENGNKVSLKDFRGSTVVLYFYPTDDTETCTKQACNFRDNYKEFKKRGITLLGVSPDTQKSHAKFKTKYDLPFTLLVDEDLTICNAYGVWQEKSMYGRTFMGVVRTTFVINEKGKITHIFPKVRVAKQIENLLEAIDKEK